MLAARPNCLPTKFWLSFRYPHPIEQARFAVTAAPGWLFVSFAVCQFDAEISTGDLSPFSCRKFTTYHALNFLFWDFLSLFFQSMAVLYSPGCPVFHPMSMAVWHSLRHH